MSKKANTLVEVAEPQEKDELAAKPEDYQKVGRVGMYKCVMVESCIVYEDRCRDGDLCMSSSECSHAGIINVYIYIYIAKLIVV